MELKTMPKKTAAELLAFLAENETFDSLERELNGSVDCGEVKALFREMSLQLHSQADAEESATFSGNPHLTRRAKQLLTCLSPTEEKALSKAFGLVE
jgi:hypothetical protein